MKHLLFILSFILLVSPLSGQSSKPPGFVIPPIIKGNLSDIQIQFLLITLDDSLSKYFDISAPPQNESGKCLSGCNIFQLDITKNDGVSELGLRWISDDYRKIETKLCVSCNTTQLNENLKDLVENLVSDSKGEKDFELGNTRKGVLFLRMVNGEYRWHSDGDEDKDGKYEGEILNEIPDSFGTLSWPDGEKYTGEWKNGRQNGKGTLTFLSGNKYEGEFKDGKYHGRGIFSWHDSDKYVGEFKDGKKHGQGIYIQTDGSKYVGEFRDGLKHGQGTLTYNKGELEGEMYVGEFKAGKKHGQGIYTYANGDRYSGEFKHSLKNGKGTLIYGKGEFEGDIYEGKFKDDKKHGQGIYTYADGSKYSGEFRRGLKNGLGTLTHSKGEAEGDIYKGEFKDDKKHGQGIYTYADGSNFSGEFKDGKKNGHGTFTWNNGNKYVGNYKKGKINGQGTQTYFDGRKYEGEWKNGEFHGHGLFSTPSGESYEGEWQEGKYHGHGTYTFGKGKWKGDKYEGQYKDGIKDGQGTYTFSDGIFFSGSFKNGKMHGQGSLTLVDGDKYDGEWNDGKYWNIKSYEKDGNITIEYVNGTKLKRLDTVNRCQDLKTHTYCSSLQTSVPPDSTQPWGKITDYSPEVFCAYDLSFSICDQITTALLAAAAEWGNYGPLEYWVLGTDEQAGQALTELYCERRDNRGQFSKESCLEEENNSQYGFESYRKTGAEAVSSGSPRMDAGRNGHREWSIHFFTSSLPLGFTDLFKVPGADEQKTVFHEYFHAVQHSHIQTKDSTKRKQFLGPVWFQEGAAEYMAQSASWKLRKSGKLPEINMKGRWPFVFKDKMKSKMTEGLRNLKACPGLKMQDLTYKTPCNNAHYDLGAWAHAWLAQKSGKQALLDIFYPHLDELGWEGAFEKTYGMTAEEFYTEFSQFLELPINQQMEILP
ncbi:MAG: hypothetical protein MAG581_01688 [Deltaproteobacteria bacterium]|nr:hypothetical protein [Deltaproteobacteria bacterium]